MADFWVAGVALVGGVGRDFLWELLGEISVGGVGEIFADVVGRVFGGWCWRHGGREDLPTFR